MVKPLLIDGSMGEGGGQILRTAVSIAAVLGIPVKVINIRAKRKNPGLRPQHLTAVKALVELTGGEARGLRVGSMELEFWPGRVRGGTYTFNIGTAGSISLLLQALLPALAFADGPVKLKIIGGTDVKMAPTIDYMRFVFRKLVSMTGYNFQVNVIRRGHYPKGGGIVEVDIPDPPGVLEPVNLVERGNLVGVEGISHCVRLPSHVAERQARSAAELIKRVLGVEPRIKLEYYERGSDPHLGPGSGIAVWAIFERSIMGSDSVGERGKRAEIVGREAASKLIEDVKTGAAVDRHASDMLPVYMALARGVSEYTGAMLTNHARTVFQLLEIMVPEADIAVEGEAGRPFRARIRGIGLTR
ncbi:MAG: RNA 3'-terminal phosphate cyclase [Desulfurococcales archaeon]|nr:RNA 3'-terminal phosphate cyclase [Desulfurococcales archaeon]